MQSRFVYVVGIAGVILLGVVSGWAIFHHQSAPIVPMPVATSTLPTPSVTPTSTVSVIGHSVEGREIQAYTFGTGSRHVLFVGGMHGGYEWNAVVLAFDIVQYFMAHPEAVPSNLTVSIIPDINPDAVAKVATTSRPISERDIVPIKDMVSARFNAHGVDLNRNFDCHWQPTSSFLGKTTSAGTAPFSEPETAALRAYVQQFKPQAVAFWHSQAGEVYGAACSGAITPADATVMNTYANAAGYRTQAIFDAYTVHGDSESWLASIGIPAVTVELTTHNTVEYIKNLAGVQALLAHIAATASSSTASTTK